MQSIAISPDQYFEELPIERKEAMNRLRRVVLDNLPQGFEETMNYGMPGYVIPHSKYPDGYHCDPKLPLPFLNIASQKNYIAFYHLGIYANQKLLSWFTDEFPRYSEHKLDMGKSCIRFKKVDDIPFDLLGKLCTKITPDEWIAAYEANVKNR